ncbi:hypothetical protein V8E54_007244 [Elaphomyces granulatus]
MESQALEVTKHDFHKHWHFVRAVSAPQDGEAAELLPPFHLLDRFPTNIFAPHVVRTRGRPRRDHSTRRNPSAFELTAGAQVQVELVARNSPQITISTPSDPNATAAVAVIPIDDPTLQITNQEQENEDLDYQLLAEMGVSSS